MLCPVLLADIGGTYARFAVPTSTGARPAPIWKVPTASFRTPLDALQPYLDEPRTPRPRSTCLAVAGRVAGGLTRLTNAPWRFDLGGIGVALGLEAVQLVNDYASLAAVLGILEEDDLRADELAPEDREPAGRPASRRAGESD
ncbi:glucokinase [Methylorubrum populi]|uniref:Glucokinase n=2 Tax=Methylorubrum rhodesianum TaxID=29427 RepID=A0ABU9Z539_9HYPH|nr:glucokinase [Methylorubrum rhodesianum]MBK3405091.1 glucokinase [Methylorubrum rhodesianum]MBY0138775.1 glucokinase [Methylorubrum populi]